MTGSRLFVHALSEGERSVAQRVAGSMCIAGAMRSDDLFEIA